MTGIATHHVIARFSRDDIEEISLSTSVHHIPLGRVGIIWFRRKWTDYGTSLFVIP